MTLFQRFAEVLKAKAIPPFQVVSDHADSLRVSYPPDGNLEIIERVGSIDGRMYWTRGEDKDEPNTFRITQREHGIPPEVCWDGQMAVQYPSLQSVAITALDLLKKVSDVQR